VYMLPPLPRCSRWAYSSLKIHPSVSAFPASTIGSACTSTFSRFARRLLTLRPAHSRSHQIRDRYPGASDISSPPCLPRLLPAGAFAGWALHPLEKRRLVTAHMESGRFGEAHQPRDDGRHRRIRQCGRTIPSCEPHLAEATVPKRAISIRLSNNIS
jgi:hypothetical protein